MQQLMRLYRLVNLLSIDVAGGAVCSALFFAYLLNVRILPYGVIALGLSVWIIYTVDHLLDAKKIKAPAATARHRFHQDNFKVLCAAVLLATIVNGIIILFIRHQVFVAGLFVALTVGIYFLINRYLKFMKEFFIAIVYTIGVLLPSVTVTQQSWSEWPWTIIAQFSLTALINLILFSWFDYERDLRDGNISFVTVLGEKTSRAFISILFIASATLAVIGFSLAGSIILGMNVILLITFIFHRYFAIHDRFRILGDFVFMIPLAYLLFSI
jgi:4-hydroxybenzoate polyprenyltransferase